MKKSDFVSPEYKAKGFTCPHCGVHASQVWEWGEPRSATWIRDSVVCALDKLHMLGHPYGKLERELKRDLERELERELCARMLAPGLHTQKLMVARCVRCEDISIWVDKRMIYPDSPGVVAPNEDLPPEVKEDYLEAASVLQKSPRAAAALLRLALQKLCKQLGGKGENIQKDIDLLVKRGMPHRVVDAMDSVRIIGNNAVHPGELDIRDNPEIATGLFDLINLAAEKTLTEPRELKEFYATLPDSRKRKNRGNSE